nr:putative ribonuclease H-like domain-containing protein [Tanacetum cinerariifolium]
SKDETPVVIKTFLKRITVLLQSHVIIIRTDNDTKFKNQMLKEHFDSVGISHQMSYVRTPQQNGVVERRNRTLVEAARTMLIFLMHRYSYGLKLLLLRVSLKTAPSFIVDLTKHHTSSLTAENWISLFFMYSGLSVIPRMIVKILGSLVQKVILAFLLVTLLIPVLTEYSAPTPTNSSSEAANFPITSQDVDEISSQQQHAQQQGNQAPIQPETIAENVPNAMFDANTFVNPFATPSISVVESSSSQYVDPSNIHTFINHALMNFNRLRITI